MPPEPGNQEKFWLRPGGGSAYWANNDGTPLGTPTKLLPGATITVWNAAQYWGLDTGTAWQTLANADIYVLGRPAFYVTSGVAATVAGAGVQATFEIEFG